jgi:hypothetical protein
VDSSSSKAAPSLAVIIVPSLIGVAILVLVGTIIIVKMRKSHLKSRPTRE